MPSAARGGAGYRFAAAYDWLQAPMNWMGGSARRRRVLRQANGDVLEVGIGTGLNLAHYPPDIRLTGIDISAGMLARARRRAAQAGVPVQLEVADVEQLPFASGSFDTVTATCVFCSVDDPVAGLREVRRVVKPGGRVLLLEHVRPRNAFLGRLADLLSPLTRRLMGPAINRRTEDNVRAAGLHIAHVLSEGVWREIVAVPRVGNEGVADR